MARLSGIVLTFAVLLLTGCGRVPAQASSNWQNQTPGLGVMHPAPMQQPTGPMSGQSHTPQPRRTLPPRRAPQR